MITFRNQKYDEERALYGVKDTAIISCEFDGPADGESALKECHDITVTDSYFNLRYPFWHVNNATIEGCDMTVNCRAALWYDENIVVRNTKLHGIKAFRECKNIKISDSDIDSVEFLWKCENIEIAHSKMNSEYQFFESKNIKINDLTMTGKYSFQYIENVHIKNSDLNTKDAFWHSKNVTVEDSIVRGEYLGWYSENLKFVRCKIIGTQPLCYCKGLVLEDCTMEETDLSFERSEVTASVRGNIMSVKNPLSGKIKCDSIDELIMETEYVNPKNTDIKCLKINKRS